VIGAGGLGHLAVQFLKILSPATVISVDQRESALAITAELGADHTVVAGPNAAAEIRAITGGRGVDHIVEVGGPGTLAQSIMACKMRGNISLIGKGDGGVSLSAPVTAGSGALIRNLSIVGTGTGGDGINASAAASLAATGGVSLTGNGLTVGFGLSLYGSVSSTVAGDIVLSGRATATNAIGLHKPVTATSGGIVVQGATLVGGVAVEAAGRHLAGRCGRAVEGMVAGLVMAMDTLHVAELVRDGMALDFLLPFLRQRTALIGGHRAGRFDVPNRGGERAGVGGELLRPGLAREESALGRARETLRMLPP
jgi:hypothetical protein